MYSKKSKSIVVDSTKRRKKPVKSKSVASKDSTQSLSELVIRMDERMKTLAEKLNRHCQRHWAIELAIIVAAIGYIVQLVFTIKP